MVVFRTDDRYGIHAGLAVERLNIVRDVGGFIATILADQFVPVLVTLAQHWQNQPLVGRYPPETRVVGSRGKRLLDGWEYIVSHGFVAMKQ